jgi:hypothetical protein
MQERPDFPLHDSAIRVLFSNLGILLLACSKPRQPVTNDFQVEHKAQIGRNLSLLEVVLVPDTMEVELKTDLAKKLWHRGR